MLSQALQSNPEIICFREVFNFSLNAIDYGVEGYDKTSKADIELRSKSPTSFLTKQIYREHADSVRAVGFKFHYSHFWGYEGLWEALVADRQIRVVHLKRRNLLRMMLSYRIAEHTGVWQDQPVSAVQDGVRQASVVTRKLTPANAVAALRRPSRAVSFLRRTFRSQRARPKAARIPMRITSDELEEFFVKTALTVLHFAELFKEHPSVTVSYEDLAADSGKAYDNVQRFLGLQPKNLSVTLRRQNPEPLSGLVENYDELRAAFKDHPYAWMFED